MFLRKNRKSANGEVYEYWTLCETVRTELGPRQRVVATLGKLSEQDLATGWKDIEALLEGRKSAPRQLLLQKEKETSNLTPSAQWELADLANLSVERVREFGSVYLALALWRRLGLHDLLSELMDCGRESVPWAEVAAVLTVGKFCGQASELGVAEEWYARTALEDLSGIAPELVNDDRLYRGLDQLGKHKDRLCEHLMQRYRDWFGVRFEFLLYDVTSTYFEGQALGNTKAARGYSRDQRSDCKQVCIGLVCTPEGLPLNYEVFAGNRVDVTTVEDVVRKMETRFGQAERIWVMDRGMVSEANIDFLRARKARAREGLAGKQADAKLRFYLHPMSQLSLQHRLRRLRSSPQMRALVRETELHPGDYILPLFVSERITEPVEVGSMPGVRQNTLESLVREAADAHAEGVASVLLFGIPSHKDEAASQAFSGEGIVQRAVRALKREVPGLLVITDVCLCEFMSHGHCGVTHFHGDRAEVENDVSVGILARTAVSHAEAGADMVAPSDMMDGRIGAMRAALDGAGYTGLPIMSYAAKFASAFYGPFRDAAESAPKAGDRRSYQMDPANGDEALREVALDVQEGADIVMVKPGLPYLDVIRRVKDGFRMPTAAYHVSGEYAMLKAAARMGWLDERAATLETMTAFRRAGADLVLTYSARDVVRWLKSG